MTPEQIQKHFQNLTGLEITNLRIQGETSSLLLCWSMFIDSMKISFSPCSDNYRVQHSAAIQLLNERNSRPFPFGADSPLPPYQLTEQLASTGSQSRSHWLEKSTGVSAGDLPSLPQIRACPWVSKMLIQSNTTSYFVAASHL
jgi:hypothetical protein